MSTGLNCEIIERTPGKWFYVLENNNAPKNSWDWREYATAYGSFPSEERAIDHLSKYQANPGGYYTITADEYTEDEVYKQLFEKAVKPSSTGCCGARIHF